ncbi:hypothetical protein NMG60_11026659 [Bertholletia excelsa]
MASRSVIAILLLLLALSSSSPAAAFEFQVGDAKGWAVPPANDSKFYNDWASENRFRVDDTVLFRYRKDSVMEVAEEEYKRCNSTHPTFFSNTGNTVFTLNRPGLFYFISGATGHCPKGQRMIIKVLTEDDSNSSGDRKSPASKAADFSGGGILALLVLYSLLYI